MRFSKFPYTPQLGLRDCGPACLKMIASYYGNDYTLDYLRQQCNITKTGVSLLGISEAAEAIGFNSMGSRVTYQQLKELEMLPCITYWNSDHFVVLYKIGKSKVYVADPAKGLMEYRPEEFVQSWTGGSQEGYVLFLEPTPEFEEPVKDGLQKKADFSRLWSYFKRYRPYFFQIFMGMMLGSVILLLTPFLTQSLVDKGINQQNMKFVYLVLFAQLVLFVGTSLVEIVRSWLLLHIGTRINISMVSDFFLKMLNLPIRFFETHITGDLMQRINDHERVEKLLTVSSLSTLFSMLNIVILGSVLVYYNLTVAGIFLGGSLLGLLWVFLFLNKRKRIDFQFFDVYSKNNNKEIEILTGVQDIKISNSARQKRWEWEEIQAKIFKVKVKSLSISQVQMTGSNIINHLTNILITFIAASSVIDGKISLGSMFAINMIVGQLRSPVEQLVNFITTLQDAKIGMERISDVVQQQDEDPAEQISLKTIPENEDIFIKDLTFHYGSEKVAPVLKNINLHIPAGKVTAIVGASGSGKTTLMKLLLRFYDPGHGNIYLGGYNFRSLHHAHWRKRCGVVMQDGQIFSGTIAANIALGETIDYEKVIHAARIANIDEFINSLPMGYMTEVGAEGSQISMGQKQRILLARAVYKNPAYLFLDEATSALDAGNEKVVMENLDRFFKGRTVVVIAHRLSTVKNADQLIVLDKGEIAETGTHHELTYRKGIYYELVKNQLELGN